MNQITKIAAAGKCVRFICLIMLLLWGGFEKLSAQPAYNETDAFNNANSRWVFPRSAGFNFNYNTPLPSQVRSTEGSVAVSDPVTGRLLFYSDGMDCYNANHQPMPNGRSLDGNGSGLHPGSTTQGVCAVPVIGSDSKYYLFSLMGLTNTPSASNYRKGSLFYSVVDMDLDNSLGDIAPGMKDIPLSRDTLSEAMVAIPGNNCDIWLLVHRYRTAEFLAYKITVDGIDTVPVISLAGWRYQGDHRYRTTQLAVSPDRSKVAISDGGQGTVILAEFDPNTGEVFNEVPIDLPNFSYGIAFSPDNSKLYVNGFLSTPQAYAGLCQMDITVFDSASIAASKRFIPNTNAEFVSLKLYKGHLYYPRKGNSEYLYRIVNPNSSGTLIFDSLYLGGSMRFRMTLPTEVVFPFTRADTVAEFTDVVLCSSGDSATLQPLADGINGYAWDDGSAYKFRKVYGAGSYHVTYTDANCQPRKDIFNVALSASARVVIMVEKDTLFTAQLYENYQWFLNGNAIPDAKGSKYVVLENGDYQVAVTDENGCYYMSEVYEVNNVNVPKGSIKHTKIFPNPVSDFIYIESDIEVKAVLFDIYGAVRAVDDQANKVPVHDLPPGVYLLKVYDQKGVLLQTERVLRK